MAEIEMSPEQPLLSAPPAMHDDKPASEMAPSSTDTPKSPLRYAILLINIFIVIGCLALVIAGALSITTLNLLAPITASNQLTGRPILIATIVLAAIDAAFVICGSIGVIRNHRTSIILFGVTSCVFLLVFLGLGGSLFKLRPDVTKGFTDQINWNFKATSDSQRSQGHGMNFAVYHIQKTFDCCGINDYRDWEKTWLKRYAHHDYVTVFRGCCRKMAAQADDVVVPRCDACLAPPNPTARTNNSTQHLPANLNDCRAVHKEPSSAVEIAVYQHGCSSVVQKAASKALHQVGGIAFVIAFTHLTCAAVTFYVLHGLLAKTKRGDKQ